MVEQINEQIKDQKMPGIVEMKLTFDDAYVVYNYTVDEEVSDMATIKEGADESKKEPLQYSCQPAFQQGFHRSDQDS